MLAVVVMVRQIQRVAAAVVLVVVAAVQTIQANLVMAVAELMPIQPGQVQPHQVHQGFTQAAVVVAIKALAVQAAVVLVESLGLQVIMVHQDKVLQAAAVVVVKCLGHLIAAAAVTAEAE
jgi:hypothetical protein